MSISRCLVDLLSHTQYPWWSGCRCVVFVCLHVVQATPRGQACFDRLLKACNVVAWDGPTIVVLHQVRVDPPYVPETCTIFTGTTHAPSSSAAAAPKKASEDASLERVRKIVAAVANEE